MTVTIDISTDFGQRVQHHLEHNLIVWLTTVDASGTPQPRPVWFVWDGEEFLIYSRPDAYKVKHIEANASVALHFDSDEHGDEVIVFTGEARIVPDEPPVKDTPVYAEKYAKGIAGLNMTPQTMGDEYSTAIRVRPDHLRGW